MSLELEVNISAVYQVNLRIEDALDKRFERDAEMYISNQDIAMIKECLYTGEYEKIYGKFKAENYHPDVFFRTIMRNAWLVKQIKEAEFKEYIHPILSQMRPEFSKELLREVAENKLDVPSLFREKLLRYYAASIDPVEAEELLLSGTSLGLQRIKVLVQRVLSRYAGTPMFITKWNNYLTYYPSLGSDVYILKRVFVEEERLKDHLEVVVNHVDSLDQPSRQLLTTLGMGGLLSFELIFNNASNYIKYVAKLQKGVKDTWAFNRMKLWLKQLQFQSDGLYKDLKLEQHQEVVFKQLIELYEDVEHINLYQAGHIIRYCFSRLRNTELRSRIIDYFKYVEVHTAFEDDLERLNHGNQNQEFKNIDEVLEAVEVTDTSNEGHFNYLANTFLRLEDTENQINNLLTIIDLNDRSHNNLIMALLGIRNKPLIWKKIIEYAERSEDMDEIVVGAIRKYVPQDYLAKTYMRHNHFQEFAQLYG